MVRYFYDGVRAFALYFAALSFLTVLFFGAFFVLSNEERLQFGMAASAAAVVFVFFVVVVVSCKRRLARLPANPVTDPPDDFYSSFARLFLGHAALASLGGVFLALILSGIAKEPAKGHAVASVAITCGLLSLVYSIFIFGMNQWSHQKIVTVFDTRARLAAELESVLSKLSYRPVKETSNAWIFHFDRADALRKYLVFGKRLLVLRDAILSHAPFVVVFEQEALHLHGAKRIVDAVADELPKRQAHIESGLQITVKTVDQLKELSNMLERGLISNEEFARLKREVLRERG